MVDIQRIAQCQLAGDRIFLGLDGQYKLEAFCCQQNRGVRCQRGEVSTNCESRKRASGNVSLLNAYLDTSVLGHWYLYSSRPSNVKTPAPRSAVASLDLLRFISNKNLHCKLETSNFALAELAQVIRDNIIASKMMRDAQSLVYFPSLKDYYELDEDEHHDLLAYFRQIMELLRTKSVTVRSLKIILSDVSAFSAIYGIDTPDSLHIAWAHERNCDFFVTSDKKLLARLKEANPVFQSIWIINPVQLIPLVNIIRNATSKTEMIKLGKQAIT